MKNALKAILAFCLRIIIAAVGFVALGWGCWGACEGLSRLFDFVAKYLQKLWVFPQIFGYLIVGSIFAALMYTVLVAVKKKKSDEEDEESEEDGEEN